MAKPRKKAAPVETVDLDTVPPPKSAALPLPKGWQRAAEALDRIEVVSTIFPDFNRASGCGGLPVNRMHTIHGPTHGGKALTYSTKILTPFGWRRFGDLQVGDVVTGANGKPCNVLGVYPQGRRQLYKATFSDGATVVCCDEHLWLTTTKQEWFRGAYARGPRPERERIPTGLHGEGSVKSFAEIRSTLDASHEVPLVAPVEYAPRDERLIIHPQVLGMLLGDGGFTGTCLTFTKPEADLLAGVACNLVGDDEAIEESDATLRIRGGATFAELQRLGLRGLCSHEKFIPEPYLFASVENRIALMRGLFDTDGHVVRGGERVEYCTTSRRLAQQVAELARGLGAYVTWREKVPTYSYNGSKFVGRQAYVLSVYFERLVPVSSQKHLAKWRGSADTQRIRRTIVAAESAGEDECMCIAVDASDHLFVVDDFVVTHNTGFALGLIKSFVEGGHAGAYIDAELSTPHEFASEVIGDLEQQPNFFGSRPDTYEETIDAVDEFLSMMSKARKDRPEMKSIVIVDSINKLTPQRELKNVLKTGGEELAKGHAGRYRAALNQAWLNHLSPLLKSAGCAMVFIAQERDNGDGELWEADGGVDVKGGQALKFDASLLIRVSKSYPMRDTSTATEKSKGDIVGFAHRVRIYKSKVSHMEGSYSDCLFHFSNGKLTPAGFDTARDAVYVGKKLGVVQASGSWLSWSKRRWQGETKAVQWLSANREVLLELISDIEAHVLRERRSRT